MAKKLKIQLVRSVIGCTGKQRRTIESLGLYKRMQTVIHDATPGVIGKLEKMVHLLKIEEVDG
jgi:large subunit ribosomal protein L30